MLTLEITAIINETPNCKTFVFASSLAVAYQPGQFLTFIFQRQGHEVRRSYSLASSPHTDKNLSITIKRTANGEISRWWIDEAKLGDTLQALEPAGVFTINFQTGTPRDIFLVAAGSGIVPLYSILKSVLIQEPQSRIILIYSNSNPDTSIYKTQLTQLQNQHPHQLTIEWMYSNSKHLLRARLSTVIFQHLLHKHNQHGIASALVYTCGPYHFMLMVQITCLTLGYNPSHLRKEQFEILQPPALRRFFDTTNRTITLLYKNQSHQLLIPYQQSILNAALKQGINLPFSCRAGRCSACRCKVLSGTVWMHYNEVLTDDDEANGYSLTCTGHPASEGVIIKID